MRPINYILSGLLGLLVQYGLDALLLVPTPPETPFDWYLGLGMFARIVASIFLGMTGLGVVLGVLKGHGREKSIPEEQPSSIEPEVVNQNIGVGAVERPVLNSWPPSHVGLHEVPKEQSPIFMIFSLIHNLMRWIVGSNAWLVIVLMSFLILYFTVRILFGEGIEAINEWKRTH